MRSVRLTQEKHNPWRLPAEGQSAGNAKLFVIGDGQPPGGGGLAAWYQHSPDHGVSNTSSLAKPSPRHVHRQGTIRAHGAQLRFARRLRDDVLCDAPQLVHPISLQDPGRTGGQDEGERAICRLESQRFELHLVANAKRDPRHEEGK